MATARYTVVLETEAKRRKLCRILLSSDGSYYVTCPYHESDRVSVSKRVVNYVKPNLHASDPSLEIATVVDDDHRLKLSHHPDGFVQFSGHGIVSGRNADGTPKGMGIQSWPLTRPTAGPACAVTVLNASAFREAKAPSPTDILFVADDLYRTQADNGFVVEMFYFPSHWRRFVRTGPRGPILWLKHPSGAIIELRVCMSPQDKHAGFVGVDMWACPVRFGDAESGFALSSPTGNLSYNEDELLEAEALYAAYPAIDESTSAIPIALAFRPRDDPSYTKGGPSPSLD